MQLLKAAEARLCQWLGQHALALAKGGPRFEHSAAGVWSLYRLGMYRSVAALPEYPETNAQFARAACLTALGEAQQAEQVARSLLNSGRLRQRGAEFIQAIAAFSPSLAESLCRDTELPPSSFLPVALAMRLGDRSLAQARLETYLSQVASPTPEACLVASNLYAASALEQCEHLNRFLAQHGLSAVRPRDEQIPLGVMNLTAVVDSEEDDALHEGHHEPLVSVLMTTYCSGERAVRAIDSLLAQRHRHLEIIVVDDASPDNTFEHLLTCAARDARVKCYQLPKNAGTYVAKTYGLQRANGQFVTCHDSDDWSHPEKISRQLAPMLKHSRIMATTSQWVRLSDEGVHFVRQAVPFTRLNPSSPLFRREVIERMGSWDLVRTGADSEFLARMKLFFGKHAVRRLVEPLAFGAHRDDSLMTAKDTGHLANAVSPARLEYWESWSRWHIQRLRYSQPLCLAPVSEGRSFAAPEAIQVPTSDIRTLLS
ncbi:glycosyltransferase family 2 protein [Halomonas sp. Cn5-12]|uniref:glycosyltransferase family 2 protein n=1 Tax=Halomonas sp. Cn5-12 TaxID=2908885 RepID=UPI001F39B237|nr:glycosyltransferase family A protein [Halomonas sp. Cn5-12]MCF2914181.1 glycosyltransferase family 2 protein [Halomonas sp. Cn5-12]